MIETGAAGRRPGEDISLEKPPPGAAGPPDRSDDRLVELARSGDLQAFEGLYRAHVGRVYAVCLRLSGDAHRAEDLTQEVFVRVWRKLDGFEGRSAFSSWVYRLAVNVVFDHRRSRKRREDREVASEENPIADRETRVAPPGMGLDLEKAIAALPEGARTAFVLHDVEGYRHDEIAEITGLSPGTSKSQLHRARKLLREWLES